MSQGSKQSNSMTGINFMNFLGQGTGNVNFDNMGEAQGGDMEQLMANPDRLQQSRAFFQLMQRNNPESFYKFMQQGQQGQQQAPHTAPQGAAQAPQQQPPVQRPPQSAGPQAQPMAGNRGGTQMPPNIMAQLNSSAFGPMGTSSGQGMNNFMGMGQGNNAGAFNASLSDINNILSQFKGQGKITPEMANFFTAIKKPEDGQDTQSPAGAAQTSSPSPNQASPSTPTNTSESPTQGAGKNLSGQKRRDSTIGQDVQPKKKVKKEDSAAPTTSNEEAVIRQLLEVNYTIIQKIRSNLFQGHIADNLQLISKFRDNIIKVLTCMSTMPGIMSQMPPIPVKLNTICIPQNPPQAGGNAPSTTGALTSQ